MEGRRLLLVHIAKTGGTSLRRLLRKSPQVSSFDCVHNNTFIRFENGRQVKRSPLDLRKLDSYDVAVLMMRHPLNRLRSCYRYFLEGGLNKRGKGRFPGDEEIQIYLQKHAPTLALCTHHLPQIAERIPHFQPACHWLDRLPNPFADLVFSGRQERFVQDTQRLFQLLELDSSSLNPERVNASKPRGGDVFSPLTLRLAEQFYSDDFRRFGYELSALPGSQLIQYWDQPDPPPALAERMDQWRCTHPSWSYRRFDRSSAADFIGSRYGQALRDAFLDIRIPAMQADVFRIAVLQDQGGVWIDAATRCLGPLEGWLNRRQPIVLLRRAHQQHPKVCNGFIHASEPGHPLLLAAWHRITKALLARRGQKIYREFGPGLLRDLLSSGDAALQGGVEVVVETDLQTQLSIGSSSEVFESDQHWSKRQRMESLYLSDGSPSNSQRSKESS